MFKIAYVEDEHDLSSLVIKYLQGEGYTVTHFVTGEDAMKEVDNPYDLWILDIMLPGSINGYDLIKSVRNKYPKMPVIFTSARDKDIDKIMGLELGSDDYIPKPFSNRELLLRVKNLLNRTYNKQEEENQIIHYEGLTGSYDVDVTRRTVYSGEEVLPLTAKEYELLIFLLQHKGTPFEREQILNHVWGQDYFGSDRVVDDLMRRLRQKMPHLQVETIYSFGYRLL